jgi:hypothetical protein
VTVLAPLPPGHGVPELPPLHIGYSVAEAPEGYVPLQIVSPKVASPELLPQLMKTSSLPGEQTPAAVWLLVLLQRSPLPVPVALTVSVYVVSVKVAVTVRAALIVTLQVGLEPEPAQSPSQPVKLHPEPAAAVSVTDVPLVKFCAHVELAPQLIEPGLEVSVPDPYVVTVRG